MKNDFWLYLSRLADAYDSSGLTPDERADMLASQFESLPAVLRKEVLVALQTVTRNLPDVYTIVNAKAQRMEQATGDATDSE